MRARSLAKILLPFVIALIALPGHLQAQDLREAEFHTFYTKFESAVRANDKNKIADLIAFPVTHWSIVRNDQFETIGIKDKAEFLAKYRTFFTPFMRSNALLGKPQKVSDEHYRLIFYDSYAKYTFEFESIASKAFRIIGLEIEPP